MSVYGGDSWGREAQYRKRRIDEVVLDGIEIDDSSYKKLSSGKYACLVCPHNPIFDTPLMLRMHCKGSRHSAAKSKVKEKELTIRDEINKRLALSGSHSTSSVNSSTTKHNSHLAGKPLIQMAQKAASEILGNKRLQHNLGSENRDMVHRPNDVKNVIFGNKRLEHNLRTENRDMVHRPNDVKNVPPDFSQNHSYYSNETSDKLIQNHLDFRERRERENLSLHLLVGNVTAMVNGTKMKMLNLIRKKKIPTPHFDGRFTRNHWENCCLEIRNLIGIGSGLNLCYKIEYMFCYQILNDPCRNNVLEITYRNTHCIFTMHLPSSKILYLIFHY